METLTIAALLGLIEGLTEFIPVSSTGHLILASEFLHLDHTKSDSFNIIIQLGAILAVVFLYRQRFFSFFSVIKFREKNNLNLIHIAWAIFPVLILGFLTRKFIKLHLFNSSTVIASLIIIGVLMIIVEKIKPTPTINSLDKISYFDAFLIGLGQCVALIPGVSRSGATMLTAMMRKINVTVAADFSFLISVPVLSAATIYEFIKSYSLFSKGDLQELLVGFAVSFVVALFGIKGFLVVLKRLSLAPFGIYRILFALFYYFFFTP